MRVSPILLAVALSATAAAAAPAADGRQMWQDRLAAHQAAQPALDARVRAAVEAFMDAPADDGTVRKADERGVYSSGQQASLARGRMRILSAWVAHLDTRPSAATSRAWLRGQEAALKDEVRVTALSARNLKASVAAESIQPFDVVVGFDRIFMMGADTEGAALELQRIADEFEAANGAAGPAAAQWSARFAGVAGQVRAEQAALRDWSRTCEQTLTSTRCARS